MKPSIIAGAILLVLAAGQANATCADTQVTNATTPDLQTLLTGKTVCAMRGTDAWQEEHHSGPVTGAPLWDYKLGDGDPIDQRKPVGTWAITGTGTSTMVSYSYTGDTGGPYQYTVHDTGDGTHYTFCGSSASDTIEASLVPGINVGCGFTPP